jgi:hypothetical protein
MKKFFVPLIAFVALMIGLAVFTLFLPAIHTQSQATEVEIGPTVESHYWGLSWIFSSDRLILYVIILLLIVFTVGYIWYKRRWGK